MKDYFCDFGYRCPNRFYQEVESFYGKLVGSKGYITRQAAYQCSENY